MTRIRAALIGCGALVMAYAVGGALNDPGVKPFGVLLFLAGVLVGHDLIWMSIVLAAGALVTTVVARRYRPVARAALIVAASLLVVALPLVIAAPPADNPSVLPLDYGRNLLVVLAGVTAVTAIGLAHRGRRARRVRKRLERVVRRGDR